MPSRTFRYTGGWQHWDVPRGVEHVTVELNGAGSGSRRGGRVTGRIRVNSKQALFILVGEEGKPNSGNTGGGTAFGGGGAGGQGRGNAGGNGGGGATAIRLNSRTGIVRAVAGGAGGDSGDGGLGGLGGGVVGQNGWLPGFDPDDPNDPQLTGVGHATGGTQEQGGNGGDSAAGSTYGGGDASDSILARGGSGGGDLPNVYGGGGGGGGYRAGGGGAAAFTGEPATLGGGGGGGSSYVGGLIGWANNQGDGGTRHGSVTITWNEPPPANQPPRPPTNVKIGRQAAQHGVATGSTGSVTISAQLSDPDRRYDADGKPVGPKNDVRLLVVYSPTPDFSRNVDRERSGLVEQANDKQGRLRETGRASVTLRGLSQNTRYYARLYTIDSRGKRSSNYTSVDFWTNRYPLAPEQRLPAENTQISEVSSLVFEWKHLDPDENSSQREYTLQWRRSRTPTQPAGEWTTVKDTTWFNQYVANPGTFSANSFYEWRVRTMDQQGTWGPYSDVRSFFVTGQATPPSLLSPSGDEAVDVSKPVTFKWQFRDPDQADTQVKADLRYRPVGTADWFSVLGTATVPGAAGEWMLPESTFMPGYRYEWQVRTQDTLTSAVSAWSESEFFWGISTPGIGTITTITPASTEPLGSLGCGESRVFVYDRGGQTLRGEITPLVRVNYARRRDDISNCVIETNGLGIDGREFLGSLRSWIHEIVVFRDGVRVWEGPITRIAYHSGAVEIEAKDVMAYLYRRIMRQGYNDTYRVVNGEQMGQSTVVERAARIAMNALAPDDPNLLPYLTSLDFPDDAKQSRSVPDFSRTAWEEIDDLAATGGLDYCSAGRRIMFWDTHRPLGRLPEMRDENFSDPPIVTEYGMSLATTFGVTNNSGVYGAVERDWSAYGMVEQLASAYGETEGGTEEAMTPEARERLEATLTAQAERNIAGRWPTPVVVRVPDNSTLSPETPVGINQLVPGVWLPLRATNPMRPMAQWQKLDLVTVEQTDKGEQVKVTMSPAPNGGQDPDADTAALEE